MEAMISFANTNPEKQFEIFNKCVSKIKWDDFVDFLMNK